MWISLVQDGSGSTSLDIVGKLISHAQTEDILVSVGSTIFDFANNIKVDEEQVFFVNFTEELVISEKVSTLCTDRAQ